LGIFEALILLGVAATGVAAFAVVLRRKKSVDWRSLAAATAPQLAARASTTEVRAELDGVTVNVRLGDPATATAKLEEGAEKLRIFVGWDVPEIPQGLEHFPKITLPVAYTFAGEMTTAASDRDVADRFLERGAQDLIDLKNNTGGRTLALIVRGGHIEVTVAGLSPTPEAVADLAKGTAKLASRLSLSERSAPALPAERRCAACMDRGGEDWTNCTKCGAAYHRACWLKAAGCVIPGCGGT
jgi:hypothetical protein